MYSGERRDKILELLRENGNCSVSQLVEIFGVSRPTATADLKALEDEGVVERRHGGASLKNYSAFAASIQLERRDNMEQKSRIGEAAAAYVQNGDNVILDSGTTVNEMVKHLVNKKDLKIVTPSISVTLTLGREPSNVILMPGGEFKAPTLSLTGEKSMEIFDGLYVEKLFLAAGGFSLEAGLTYPSFTDMALKKAMVNSAKTIYLLADSSKLEKIQFAHLGCLDKINYLITDDGIDKAYAKKIEALGIKVYVV
jgi:DeoR/GlpR family transcriptional regulator of sugar metabolism